MRTPLESGLFCFNEQYQYPPTDIFFRPNFTGRSKIDINVLQKENQDIISWLLY